MLQNQMPEIPYTARNGILSRFEALAYTCIASYCDQPIQPRVLLSFQRAFDVYAMFVVNRVANGHPGYCIASYFGKPQPKVIVAFEGATAWSQIVELYNLNVRASVGTLPGYVYSKFQQHAAAIKTELDGKPEFSWALGQVGAPVIFTGFSLGAAIAEIVAAMYKVQFPQKAMKVIKFAAPRIGTTNWVRNRSPLILRDQVYMGRDPIDLFPYTLPPSAGLSTLNPAYNYTAWANGGEGTRLALDWRESPLPTLHQGGYQQAAQAARALRVTMDRSNPWSDHNKWYYYLAMMTNYIANDRNVTARMKYLEFNDRNKFGEAWQGERAITVDMESLHSPDPAPVSVDFTVDELTAMADALVNAGADPSEVMYPDSYADGIGGGGETFGGEERVIPAIRDITRPAPAVFVYPASGRRRR